MAQGLPGERLFYSRSSMVGQGFLFPGQGSQYVGMGKDFYDSFSEAKAIFDEADLLLSFPLSRILFEGPMEELTKTKNSQLAIFVVSAAILAVLESQCPFLQRKACAGLSLGEYTALYAAGVFSFKEALFLIEKRASFMNEACENKKGSMAAVLGLEDKVVRQLLKSIPEVWIANYNTPGQIVISGSEEGIQKATFSLKEAKAKRIIPLSVHGAFHSPFMKEAAEKLAPYIEKASFSSEKVPVIMNVTGKTAGKGKIKDLLKKQVTHSVLWHPSILHMKGLGIDTFLEIGCGKSLSSMNRKIDPALCSFSIEKVGDLAKIKGERKSFLC